MKTQLLLAGVACVVAAVVGGGLKLLGAEIPLISSTRRQALLAVIGVALLVWGGTLPSEQEQQRQQQLLEQEQQRQQQRRQLATELNARLEQIGTDFNRRLHGQEVPGLIEGNDIPALTEVYEDLETNRATLDDDLYGLLRHKAQLALDLANVTSQEELSKITRQWNSVNQELTERLR